uniref:Ig-like domain-containing protein n=1 Tax=Amphilophus citrinellus TaxID=61819 RepID=A0A3Q0RSJ5_AMPCI
MFTPACLCVLLLVAVLDSAGAHAVPSYFTVSGTLVLRPAQVTEQITSIVWKYDKDLLAEWIEGQINLTYYSRFKGRSHLNTTTGVLEIHSMTTAETGEYSVEINNNVQSQVYQAVEIKYVPQPEVTVEPLMCSTTSENCTLTCDGDTEQAEPVAYFWKKGDGGWEQSEKDVEILNDEETQCVKTFSCRMKNPVSERDSEPIDNPLCQEEEPGCGLCITVSRAVMRSLLILAPFWVAVSLWIKRETLCKCRNEDSTAETKPSP